MSHVQGFQNKQAAARAPAVASMLIASYFFFSVKAGKEPSVLFIGSQPATSDQLSLFSGRGPHFFHSSLGRVWFF
jgi:hypothetical protein